MLSRRRLLLGALGLPVLAILRPALAAMPPAPAPALPSPPLPSLPDQALPDRVILPMCSGVEIRPGASIRITSRTQNCTMRVESMAVSRASREFKVESVVVGKDRWEDLCDAAPDGRSFYRGRQGPSIASPTSDVVVEVTNRGQVAAPFFAAMLGTVA